jgi:hypothetical protein
MDETDISWKSDRESKFKQVDGFKKEMITKGSTTCPASIPNCEIYNDPKTNLTWAYYYPDDATTQYLYESYPMVVSPIEGVENEHFIVWMRAAGLPTFRKLYGKINNDFKKGDKLAFHINANFEVDSFDGSKSIVISTIGQFGGKNSFLGVSYIVVGSVSFLLAFLFGIKQIVSPRQLGDTRYLGWSK